MASKMGSARPEAPARSRKGKRRTTRPIRVAVIGGGCASLTAAYELTRPEQEGRFAVTVYQMGWRLGGKGASGRGVANRIEEHGLHLWMGFYENAFQLMRECYAELPRENRRYTSWRDAFSPAPDVAVTDRSATGEWDFWVARFPAGQGLPGDPIQPGAFNTVSRYLRQSTALLAELVRSAHAMESGAGPTHQDPADPPPRPPISPDALASAADALLRYGRLATATALFQAVDLLRGAFETWLPPALREGADPLLRLTEAAATAARAQLRQFTRGDGEARRVWQVIDLIIAVIRGSTVHGLAFDPRGFDAINEYDWREWLRLHGASEESLDSGFMRAIYGLVFAFEDGDVTRPRLAAGVALRGAVRMFFTYRGALFWRMNGGMGDVVFSPLYEVLKQRGVRFEFFHRLREVRLGPPSRAEPHVESLELDVQARIRGGGEYQPLVWVQGVPSWSARPDYTQLEDGARHEAEAWAFESLWDERRVGSRTLRVGKDFDFVVLGVSIGAIPLVAGELIERNARWRGMVEHVKTVPTQAFQVWLRENVDELGWAHAPVNLSGFVEPFDTWADMRHLIQEESWTRPVKSIAYFCSVLPDPGAPDGAGPECFRGEQRAAVRDNAVRFLRSDVGALWPGALNERGDFRWELLVTEGAGEAGRRRGAGRFDSQYWTANVDPNERYVLSLPGSCRHRISPLDMSFDNLTIAGDWTASGLDSGCIESAVMSGRLAAHALSGSPALADIVGYDHP